MKLSGKTAIVTGGAKGIGEAIAVRFGIEGARVVVSDVDESGERVAAAIREQSGEAVFVGADVSDEEQVRAMVDRVIGEYGRIDVLVNNAGIIRFTPWDDFNVADWDRVIAVNLTGVMLCSKYAIPHMRAAGGGAIVNISSVHASVTGPAVAAYAASKGGVLVLTRSMALELAPANIRVNSILPGYIRTPLFLSDVDRRPDPAAFVNEIESKIPAGRVGDPSEIAGVAVFAASDDASYMTGAALAIDGGVSVLL